MELIMRHPEPEWINGGDRCCHTCLNYLDDGICDIFKEVPPVEFASNVDQCEQWVDEIPF